MTYRFAYRYRDWSGASGELAVDLGTVGAAISYSQKVCGLAWQEFDGKLRVESKKVVGLTV
jgi:hypothetical protein